MLFKDYLEKCLEDENFREEWNKQHEEEKKIHIELMNKFIEIAENNIKPIIYKTNYEGWSMLYRNMGKKYRMINYEKIGHPLAYYVKDKSEVLFLISEHDNDYFYIKYKNQKLEFIHSKERLDPIAGKTMFGTYCDFAYNLNNDLVILTRDDRFRLYYYLVFGKEDIKETKSIKKIDFISEMEESCLDRKFYFENHNNDFIKIGEKIIEYLKKKDIDSIKEYFSNDIDYTDINTYGFYEKNLSNIFKILLESKEIIKTLSKEGGYGVYLIFQIKEKDDRVRNVIYSLGFNRKYTVNYVEKIEPWLFGFDEYEEEK